MNVSGLISDVNIIVAGQLNLVEARCGNKLKL